MREEPAKKTTDQVANGCAECDDDGMRERYASLESVWDEEGMPTGVTYIKKKR